MELERKDLKNYSILIVDDESEIIEPLQNILKHRFKEIFTASNGKEGVDSFLANRPDIIVTDIKMPVMNGLDMAEKIKDIDPHVPIVVSSAFNETELLLRAIEIGVTQYLLKPIELEKLFKIVEQSIKHKVLEARIEVKNQELEHKNRKLTEYKNAIELSTIVSKTDRQGKIIELNSRFEEYIGESKENITGKDCDCCIDNKDVINIDAIKESIKERGFFKAISEDTSSKTGSKFANLTVIPTYDGNGEIEEYLYLREDITAVVNRIYTDPLTNYPNRSALSKDIETIENPTLAFFNIDSFKELNDFYGIKVGDYLLKKVIILIDEHLKEMGDDCGVYKLSSDEFAVLLKSADSNKSIAILKDLQRFLESYSFNFEDYSIELNFSVGFCDEKKDILIKTDMAIKYAKNNHKSFINYEHIPDARESFKENIFWTKKLKKAIEDDRIITHYQPIVNLNDKSKKKYECLVRLVDDNGDIISPFKFLNVAYKTRLSKKLTKKVIDKSFAYFLERDCDFSINMSATDIVDEDIREYLYRKIDECNVASKLTVEILESEEINFYENVKDFVKEVKGKGAKVAIDDFGSGYSNFQHILNLDVDIIKIDGSIIQEIDKDQNSFAIAKTITGFAKKLGIETVAEFVATKEILEKVQELNVDFSQGYYTGKPAGEAD